MQARSERWLFAGLVLLALLLISRGPNSMDGDAPHYLAVSHSLVHDFDLDLTNQYDPATEYLFYPGEMGGHARPGRGGRLYPFHYIGLSVALAPVYFIAEQIALALPDPLLEAIRWDRERACRDLLSLALALLYAATAVLTLRVSRMILITPGPSEGVAQGEGREATGRVAQIAVFATALAFATPPLLSISILAFTEIPAAFLGAWFLYERLRPGKRPQLQLLALALLPWLHIRYAVISVSGFVWMVARSPSREHGLSERIGSHLLVPVLSAVLLASSGWWMFGSLLPVGQFDAGLGLSMGTWGVGLVGLFLDRHFGLLAVAPFWLLALAGARSVFRSHAGYVGFAVISLIGTWLIAAVNTMWWGGYCPPARLIIPILPLLVPLLAAGLRALLRSSVRWLVYLTVGWSAVMTVLMLIEPVRLWSDAENGTGLSSALPLVPRLFPSLADTATPWLHVAFAVTATAALAVVIVRAGRTEDAQPPGASRQA